MATPRRTLTALLASVAPDLRTLTCADLTAEQVARGLLPAEPESGGLLDLVVVEEERIADALARTHGESILLVLCPADAPTDIPGLQIRARVAAGEVQWRLCVPLPRAANNLAHACTVVVPVQDEAGPLARLLTVLAAEPPAPPWELIVVDRGSLDRTAGLLRCVQGAIRTLRLDRRATVDEAIRAGLKVARTSRVLTLSPHWIPEHGWREAIEAALEAHPEAGAILGALIDAPTGRALPPRAGPLGAPTLYPLPLRPRGPVVLWPGLRLRQVIDAAPAGFDMQPVEDVPTKPLADPGSA